LAAVRFPYRLCFAFALWFAAAIPVLIYGAYAVSPSLAVRAAHAISRGVEWLLWGTLLVGVLLALVYPPFFPGIRLWLRRAKLRLSVSEAPLQQALARLRSFENPDDHLVAGRAFRERGSLPRALPHLLRAVQLAPEHVSARYQLALALLEVGQVEEAISQLGIVLERDERHAYGQPFIQLASALVRAGRHARALDALQRHAALHGETREAACLAARIHTFLGERDAARAALERAASPPAQGQRMTLEEEYARGKARAALRHMGSL
jgi:tetratricopeptide (TPR) repeat protein